MAIFGIIFIILALIIPIAIIALVIHLISKKNANNNVEKKDNFEKIIRTIYTYILVLGFLIATVASFISAIDLLADYLLPEEKELTYYDEDYDYRRQALNERNDKHQMIVEMVTNFAIFAISTPMFVYHINLTKKDK